MKHNWAYSHEDGNDHVWKCTQCPAIIGFNKQGIGNPWASATEHPVDIDKYVEPNECPDTVSEASTRGLLQIMLKTVDVDAAVAAGTITSAEGDALKALRDESKGVSK